LEGDDDGKGFDAAGSFPGHLGLKSMRERVAHLGGTLWIESAPGEGSRIRVRIPAGT
jgi:signal transduction histidine kinase